MLVSRASWMGSTVTVHHGDANETDPVVWCGVVWCGVPVVCAAGRRPSMVRSPWLTHWPRLARPAVS